MVVPLIVMHSRWLIAVALGGVAAVASGVTTASTAQSLNHTVTPGKPMSGPVRLSFDNAYLSHNSGGSHAGAYHANVTSTRLATLTIENLQAPALVRCDVTWAEFKGPQTFEVREFHGQDLAATGKSHSIFMGPTQDLQFIADPDPAGDYAYEMQFAPGSAQRLFGCKVTTL